MRNIFKKKLVHILFAVVFVLTTVVGCSGSEDDIKELNSYVE